MVIINNFGVRLKQLTHDKIELVRQWRNDPKISRYMEFRDEITPKMQEEWFRKISSSNTDYYFIIEAEGKEIGLTNIRDIDYAKKEGEPGIFIWDDSFLNSDYSFRSSLCLLDFAFDELGLDTLIAHVLRDNKRAVDFNLFWGYVLCPGQEDVLNQKYILKKEKYYEKRNKLVRLFK